MHGIEQHLKAGTPRACPWVSQNYNHRLLWDHVKPKKCNKAFDYYPRGRVELSNKGKPVIYMSTNIGMEFIPKIMELFEINEEPKIHYDGSEHYKSYCD